MRTCNYVPAASEARTHFRALWSKLRVISADRSDATRTRFREASPPLALSSGSDASSFTIAMFLTSVRSAALSDAPVNGLVKLPVGGTGEVRTRARRYAHEG